jgi:hypothetical protein
MPVDDPPVRLEHDRVAERGDAEVDGPAMRRRYRAQG